MLMLSIYRLLTLTKTYRFIGIGHNFNILVALIFFIIHYSSNFIHCIAFATKRSPNRVIVIVVTVSTAQLIEFHYTFI